MDLSEHGISHSIGELRRKGARPHDYYLLAIAVRDAARAESAGEVERLRARVTELEGEVETMWGCMRTKQNELDQCRVVELGLHARLAALDAPPVVPVGYRVFFDTEGPPHCWCWDCSDDAPGWVDGRMTGEYLWRVELARAWASKNNARPPHAADEVAVTHQRVPGSYAAHEQAATAQRLIDEGWNCYPPGSSVPALVEAAVARCDAYSEFLASGVLDPPSTSNEQEALTRRLCDAERKLLSAAFAVAKERQG